MRISSSKIMAAGVAFGIAAFCLAIPSHAATVTFIQTTEGCGGGCGVTSANKVVVSDSPGSGVFDISVTLDTGWLFQADPTGNGHAASFGFANTSGLLTINSVTSGFTANAGNPVTVGGSTHFQIAPYSFSTFAYGVSTSSQQVYNALDFHVDTGVSSETLAQFILTFLTADTGSAIFAADVFSGITGNTGGIGFVQCGPGAGISCPNFQNPTPLPGAVWLFGTVLAGAAGVGGWRRKKRKLGSTFASA